MANMRRIRPLVTVGSLYIVSDPLIDAIMCYIPEPFDWLFYAGRYVALVLWGLRRVLKK